MTAGYKNRAPKIWHPSFIVTDNPQLLSLIYIPGVEGVLWKRDGDPDVVRAIRELEKMRAHFTAGKIIPNKERFEGWDGGQYFMTEARRRKFPELLPLWRERATVKAALKKNLHIPGDNLYTSPLMIQPARRRTSDIVYHRDHFFTPQKDKPLLATVTHKGPGTFGLPSAHAGRATPYFNVAAANYYHPRSLSAQIQAEEHDVFLLKLGKAGGVHRAPFVNSGARWLSIYSTGHSDYYSAKLKGLLDLRF